LPVSLHIRFAISVELLSLDDLRLSFSPRDTLT
jgi:hypothetical protein